MACIDHSCKPQRSGTVSLWGPHLAYGLWLMGSISAADSRCPLHFVPNMAIGLKPCWFCGMVAPDHIGSNCPSNPKNTGRYNYNPCWYCNDPNPDHPGRHCPALRWRYNHCWFCNDPNPDLPGCTVQHVDTCMRTGRLQRSDGGRLQRSGDAMSVVDCTRCKASTGLVALRPTLIAMSVVDQIGV